MNCYDAVNFDSAEVDETNTYRFNPTDNDLEIIEAVKPKFEVNKKKVRSMFEKRLSEKKTQKAEESNKFKWVEDIGHHLIKSVSVEINGVPQPHMGVDSKMMQLWNELAKSS